MQRILTLCRHGWPLETGGVLIGYYTEALDEAVVTDALGPPSDSRFRPCSFLRGVRGLATLLRRLWRRTPRRYYLGEWHLHPNASPSPSLRDRAQMQEIAAGDYNCSDPILLIVGGERGDVWHTQLWVFCQNSEPIPLIGDG